MHAAITCPSLTSPANGSVMYTSAADEDGFYPFNAVVIYNCNIGFSLVGDSNKTCTGNGSSVTGIFNGMAPTCEGTATVYFCQSLQNFIF